MHLSMTLPAVLVVASALGFGCRRGDDQKSEAALARADAAATKLGATLRAKLGEALARGGPAAAVDVCSGQAQAIRGDVARDFGVAVGRSSLRLRTPADAPPDWVAEWLRATGERKAEGAVGVRAVVDTPRGKVARVLRPIVVEAPCLACHGDAAALDPAVKATLVAKYPTDTATGYREGELRGALWAEALLE